MNKLPKQSLKELDTAESGYEAHIVIKRTQLIGRMLFS